MTNGESKRESDGTVRDRSWKQMTGILWHHRRVIGGVSGGAGVLVLIINLFLPSYYRATASLLPDTENRAATISQFTDLAQLAGIGHSSGEIARLYPDILRSETVLRAAIFRPYPSERFDHPVDLVEFLGIREDTRPEEIETTLESVRDLMTVAIDNRTTIVTVSIEMREPGVAADVLNAVIEELDRFLRFKRKTSAGEQLEWINARMQEVQGELKAAEDSLEHFRDRNRRILDSPGLLLTQERLLRSVEISSATYVELNKQRELAKIDVIKNSSVVNVLDPARPPTEKSRPRRALNTLMSMLAAALFLSSYFVLWKDRE